MSILFPVEKNELELLSPLVPEDILSWGKKSDEVRIYAIGEEEKTVGAAAVHIPSSRAELLWFYVDETYRGYGIGSKCFYQLMTELRDLGAEELSTGIYSDTDGAIIRLLNGFHMSYEPLPVCRISFTADRIAEAPDLLRPSQGSVSLRSCREEELKELQKRLAAAGRDIFDVTADGYNTTVSAVYKEDGKAEAALLFKRMGPGEISLYFAVSVAKDPTCLMDMLRFSAASIRDLPDETVISMNIINKKVKDMALLLLENVTDLKIEEGKLAVLSLSYVDWIRAQVETEMEMIRELAIA